MSGLCQYDGECRAGTAEADSAGTPAASAAWQSALHVLASVLESPFPQRSRATSDPDGAQADGFDAAVALYRRGEWTASFALLAREADDGNARAAKLALLMLRYGESVYGLRLFAAPPRIARWARCVIVAGGLTRPDPEVFGGE